MRRSAPHAVVALFAVAGLAACGGSSTVTRCAGQASGKVNGTLSVCNAFDQFYRVNLNQFVLTAAYTELPTAFVMSTEWELRGEPQKRSYDQDDLSVDCKVTIKKGTPSWLARKGSGVPTSGTCQLVLTELVERPQEGNLVTYHSRGTLAARLEAEPGTGATESITFSMDFCTGDAAFCPPMMP